MINTFTLLMMLVSGGVCRIVPVHTHGQVVNVAVCPLPPGPSLYDHAEREELAPVEPRDGGKKGPHPE